MQNDQKKPQTPITDHLRATGGWNPNWDSFAELDPVWTEKFMDAGATPDDLLKLGHRADSTVKDDEPASLGVHASGEQPRGRDKNGILCFGVDEVSELRLPLRVAPRDAHDIAVVFVAQVFVFVN